jgi:MIZ/SP-RING zinc finger
MMVNGKAPRFEIPPIPTKPQPSDAVFHKKWFPIGLPQFTGALAPRPMGEFSWKDSILTNNESLDVIRRLYTWEPYWDMVNILALTKTSIIESIAHMEKPKEADKDKFLPPQQHRAFEVKLAVPLQYQKLIQGWNSPKGERRYIYESGEVRLLLRMLPCNPPQKPTGKSALKKKVMRSDYHIWPKGTFLQIDGAAREIVQRKQQSHNTSEWSYLSRMLDMTQFVEAPESITVSALTHDADPYYLCVSVCRYRPPENLFEFLMKDKIQILSREESIQIAMDYAKKNKVCVIDDVDHDQCGSSSFLFKLTCPISSTLMATPVRSHQCNHFQCFDLLNFLYVNANVSGTRWECPVCNDQTISVFDLQHCALTEKLLQQFKNEASSFRDRVEFFSDGTWKLMPERRKRYSESHSLQSNDTKRKKGAEVDLIIL